jgi:uncharacterized membrane protein HdeD (DUF308 family)
MSDEKKLKALNIMNIVIGVILVAISILVVVFSTWAMLVLMMILSISIIIIGMARIVNGTGNKILKKRVRIMKGITGALVLFFGLWTLFTTIIDPSTSIELLIFLLASAFLIIGISRFTFGFQATKFPSWFRIIILITGIISMGLSIMIFILPPIGYYYLLLMLAFPLLLNGVARIALGAVKI